MSRSIHVYVMNTTLQPNADTFRIPHHESHESDGISDAIELESDQQRAREISDATNRAIGAYAQEGIAELDRLMDSEATVKSPAESAAIAAEISPAERAIYIAKISAYLTQIRHDTYESKQ